MTQPKTGGLVSEGPQVKSMCSPRRFVAIRVYGGAGGGGDSEGTISDSENSTTGDPDDFLPSGEGGGAVADGGTGIDCSHCS